MKRAEIHKNNPEGVRGLTAQEIALFSQSFTKEFEIERVRLINRYHNPFAKRKILVRGYDIYWENYPEDFTIQSLTVRALLMHELCHVWQYATGRLSLWRYITQPKNWFYGYEFNEAQNFDDYPIEKQADLLQDWYIMNHGLPSCHHDKGSCAPELNQLNSLIPFAWDLEPDDKYEAQDILIS